jgi:hypothetical protein
VAFAIYLDGGVAALKLLLGVVRIIFYIRTYMDTKLTLKLDDGVIEQAKIYARKKNTSLSELVEAYLRFLTAGNQPEGGAEVSPLVKSLSGVLDPDMSLDYKTSYKKHLTKKYTR